jgi:hypothetical protein
MMPNVERSYRITLGRWLRLYIVAFGALWIGLLVQVMLAGNIGSWFVPVILGLSGRPVVHTVLRARRGCRP